MSDQTSAEVAAISKAVTGPDTPNAIKVDRPSTKSEWTLIVALGASAFFTFLIVGILTWWFHWDVKTEHQRINFLGWIGCAMAGGILLVVIAVASPWVGHVSARAGPGGAEIGIDGKSD